MRLARFGLVLCILVFNTSTWSQQTQPGTAPVPAPKDPQAVSALNQALAIAGGTTAIAAITDYTVTGSITYQLTQQVQGTVMLRGLGLGEFRMDANLPTGVRTELVNGDAALKTEDGAVKHYQPPMNPGSLAIPVMFLTPAVGSSGFGISYKGIVQINGHSAHEIQVQRVLPLADPTGKFLQYHTADYFIDTSTLQIVMVQDFVPIRSIRQITYADFRIVSGVLVPFSINEQINGQTTWTINVGTFAFNSGLQDSDFQL